MKYIIYGANRVAKDFLYLFDKLDILYIADDTAWDETFCGYEVRNIADAAADPSCDRIIVCDFEKTSRDRKLQSLGLNYGKDYLYEEDFFTEFDEIRIPEDRTTAVWGTGNIAGMLLDGQLPCRVDILIDSYKSRDSFKGIPVYSPEQISGWENYFIIIAVERDAEIRKALEEKGLRENIDYAGYQRIIGRPSDMLRRTIFDRSCYDVTCNTMLNHLEIFSGGNTRCCCTTFVRQNLDNLFEKDMEGLWHSPLHKIMCLSTENRTYSFCDKNMCPLFVEKKNSPVTDLERSYRQMSQVPEVLALGHDSSCNLSCETCRREVHFAKGAEAEKIKEITERIMRDYLPGCRFLILAGDGEVFASPAYREIYTSEKCNPDYIRILSNGTLFTPENWKALTTGKTGKFMLTVSIDAATKDTYEKIRRNGNFDRLRQNMEYAAELKRSGELDYFRINFVVQKENYEEMPLFVRWGEALDVNEVFFTKILNWGTYTDAAFAQVSMMEADGITPKPELKRVLEDPAMKSAIVDLGTIQYAHKVDETGIVENYYMWELEKRGGFLFETKL